MGTLRVTVQNCARIIHVTDYHTIVYLFRLQGGFIALLFEHWRTEKQFIFIVPTRYKIQSIYDERKHGKFCYFIGRFFFPHCMIQTWNILVTENFI